jgi:hypothetical protein
MHQPGPLARGNTRPIRPGPQPNLPSSRCGSCDSVSRSPDARPPVASLRCSQSRLASSSPFPVHPKGLNPSLLAPALRPPVCPLLLRPPAPVQPRVVAFASRPGLHGHLCPVGCAAPNASSAPTTAEPKPSARPHARQRRRTAPATAAVRASSGIAAARSRRGTCRLVL